MTALDERDQWFGRVPAQKLRRRRRRVGCRAAVAKAVHGSDEGAVGEPSDDCLVAGRRLARPRPRRDATFQQ
jgi:hypothetical protein